MDVRSGSTCCTGRGVVTELRDRFVAVTAGIVTQDLVVGAVLLDDVEHVLDRTICRQCSIRWGGSEVRRLNLGICLSGESRKLVSRWYVEYPDAADEHVRDVVDRWLRIAVGTGAVALARCPSELA